MRLLIIEDEKALTDTLQQILVREGYTVDIANDGQCGLDYGLSAIYDVILLDIMLPIIDGLTILSTLRKEGITTPIIMLTAKGQVEDKVKGLDYGADDYLPKPFVIQELLARIRANGRRKTNVFIPDIISYGDLRFHKEQLSISTLQQTINVTLKEAELFELFLRNPTQVLSKDLIIEKVWGFDADIDYNHVEVYISFLRKKLTHLNSCVSIQTIRGIGYTLQGDSHV